MNRGWSQRGFSLIEVAVCMLILAVGMVAGLGMTQAGQIGLDAGRCISFATGLAQAIMEEKVSVHYTELLTGSLEGKDEAVGFIRTWIILPDTPIANLLTIQVVVEWKDKTGRSHRVRLATLRGSGVTL